MPAMDDRSDRYFMGLALEQAHIAQALGEVPVGAVVVRAVRATRQQEGRELAAQQPVKVRMTGQGSLPRTLVDNPISTGTPTLSPYPCPQHQHFPDPISTDTPTLSDASSPGEAVLVSQAHNRRETDANPAAHAEFLAIVKAARTLGRWRLDDCAVYVTLEPCVMCAGLMQQARIARCVYAAPDPKAGALGSLYRIHTDSRLNHSFVVKSGVCEQESAHLLSDFFAHLRCQRKLKRTLAEDKRARL
ncbi:MAG: nucleoside deaminase [Coriobacteriales bacterium]|jgi:tRNA(adenine34) deaminase|nr:nucleoside deaminase [Coriobacteriales bacterium]